MKLFELTGAVAFVTGAGSGIGQRVAVGLAEAGADVLCFDLPAAAGLADTARDIQSQGRKAEIYTGSVCDEKELAEAVKYAGDLLGPVSIAVNSAGIANACPAEDMSFAQWDALMNVNLRGVFLSCREEARSMMANGMRGSIINIGSMSGVIANRGLQQCHYNASKAAVIHLTKSLATEWCDKGIRVNCISPGYTATAMNLRAEVADRVKKFEAETPMRRMASVDEIYGAVIFFASKASSFCTGVNLLVDGGLVCH